MTGVLETNAVVRNAPSETLSPSVSVPSETAARRKDQIVSAAKEIIAREGIHRFSLGRLEKQVDMARGHLTYYFPTKEAILLAVFDRMLAEMKAQLPAEAEKVGGPRPMTGRMKEILPFVFTFRQSDLPAHRDFLSLVWAFSAQMNHRPDFRKRLAEANAGWRSMMAADYETSVPSPPPARPEAVACVLMALMSGLDGQLAADPDAFDRTEIAELCLQLLAPLFPEHPPKDGAP